MDYSKITADPAVGRSIGRLYMQAPSRPDAESVRTAYGAFIRQINWQYDLMTRPESKGGYGIRVVPQSADPYPDAEAMFEDVRRGVLLTLRTPDSHHPILSGETNDRFRAVHDFFGHYMSGRGFDRHGEEAAWVCHSRLFIGSAVRAMTTETRGQSSAFVWINDGKEFPPQKAVLLPPWVSEVPVKWLT